MAALLRFIVLFFSLLIYVNSYAGQQVKVLKIPLWTAGVSLNPTGVQGVPSLWVSRQINCQLVRSQGSAITLDAAKSIKYLSPKKILITLNSEAKFIDGSPVTAKDVVASFNYLKSSRNLMRNIFRWVRSVKAISRNKVLFTLRQQSPLFLQVLASPNYAIFKASFIAKAKKNSKLWRYPIGCGGYKVANQAKKYIRLSPVGKGPNIYFYYFPESKLPRSKIEDFDIISQDLIQSNIEKLGFRSIKEFDPVQIFIGLNTKKSIWQNRNRRCAFLSRLNFSNVLNAYGNIAHSANDFFPVGVLGYSHSENFMGKIRLSSHKKPEAVPEKFCLAFLDMSIPQNKQKDFVAMVKNALPEATMQILHIKEAKGLARNFLESGCDAMVLGLKSNYLDGYEYAMMYSEKSGNFMGYHNKLLDSKIEASQHITELTKKAKSYRAVVNLITHSCTIAPILTIPMKTVWVKRYLKTPGLGRSALNNYYLGNVS